jgi:hypothetical protein
MIDRETLSDNERYTEYLMQTEFEVYYSSFIHDLNSKNNMC